MKRNAHRSGKAAEFYVAAELTKRGYTVALPAGNVACTDLFVESPSGGVFGVEVKALCKPNFWLIKDSPKDDKRYFILVFMPDDKPPEFFIFNSAEMHKEKQIYLDSKKSFLNKLKRPELEQGLRFKQPFLYRDKWNSLPE